MACWWILRPRSHACGPAGRFEHGLVPDEVVRRAHGRPSLATIIELLPNGDHDAENRELERREIEDIADVVALPGALELLQTIPEARWTIVTSASRRLAEVRLRAAGLPLPKHLVTASDLKRGKPFPDPYLKRRGDSWESLQRIVLLRKMLPQEFARAKRLARAYWDCSRHRERKSF